MQKRSYIFLVLFGIFAEWFLLSSCNDDLTMVGTTIQPSSDHITVFTDTFQLTASTVVLDSIFAKTSTCLLGDMYHPVYGNIKADFLCQFYCQEDFRFTFEPYQGVIDSAVMFILYPSSSWYGDSLAPMQVTIFPITKPLKRNFYSNDNPENYCDMTHPLASKSYTPFDKTISDSIRAITDTYDANYYTPNIRIKLPVEFGQNFYDETINNPASFASQSAFNAFFPGLYITTTFGSGNLLKTYGEYMYLRFYYNTILKDIDGADSIVFRFDDFTVSKEVNQINRFKNSNIDKLLTNTGDFTYIKSPAGVCTKIIIPTTQISSKIDVSERFINAFSLNLKFIPEEEEALFSVYPPHNLLLIPEDSVQTFFENNQSEDTKITYISYDGTASGSSSNTTSAGYSYYFRSYSFGNISALIEDHIKKSPDKDLSLLVIPVNRTVTSSSSSSYYYYSSSSYTYYTTGITNSFDLAGVKIRTDGDYLKVVAVSSMFTDK